MVCEFRRRKENTHQLLDIQWGLQSKGGILTLCKCSLGLNGGVIYIQNMKQVSRSRQESAAETKALSVLKFFFPGMLRI